LLLAGVGVSLLPGWQLDRELKGARADGLALEPLPFRKVPEARDLGPAYREAARRYPSGTRTLLMTPNHPTPEMTTYVREVGRIAARGDFSSVLGYSADLVATAGRVTARTAHNEAELLPAAYIARSLRRDDDLSATLYWAKTAEATLDAMDRLHLTPSARRRVLTALGPSLDVREILRHRMASVMSERELEFLPADPLARLPVYRTRKRARYVSEWRTFWRTAPRDPEALALALDQAGPRLKGIENDLGWYTGMPAVFGRHDLASWARKIGSLQERMRT
jgi:hypothetical protein